MDINHAHFTDLVEDGQVEVVVVVGDGDLAAQVDAHTDGVVGQTYRRQANFIFKILETKALSICSQGHKHIVVPLMGKVHFNFIFLLPRQCNHFLVWPRSVHLFFSPVQYLWRL